MSLDAILQSSLRGPLEGPAAHANANLLLSCIQGKPTPAVELANILHQLVHSPDLAAEATAGVASGVSEIIGKGNAEETEANAEQEGAAVKPEHEFALLLVQQLLASLQQASQALQWHCSELDALACQLVDMHGTSPPGLAAQQQTVSDPTPLFHSSEEHRRWRQRQRKTEEKREKDVPMTFDNAGYEVAQLLGLLLKGRESSSLLSDVTVQEILSKVKVTLEERGTSSPCLLSQHWCHCPLQYALQIDSSSVHTHHGNNQPLSAAYQQRFR